MARLPASKTRDDPEGESGGAVASDLKNSPLHEIHAELGAHFTDFAGWNMPLRYASELAEHRAVRQSAGLFDLSHMGEIVVDGPAAEEALNYALVGNISTVKVGRARYTMLCAPDGGVLDDMVVYRASDERFVIVANAANIAGDHAAVAERATGFDATVTDASADYALIAVQGPAAVAILTPLTNEDPGDLRYYAWQPATVAGVQLMLARTGYTGEDGFELYVAPGEAPGLWRAIASAGQSYDLLPAGLACRDTLRLEAGMALYGNELSQRVTPFEANLGRLVRFDKPGDFVGREALSARKDAEPSTVLAGLTGSGRRAGRHGYAVLDDPDDGTRVGEITSGVLSPSLGMPIAMAFLDPAHAEPGRRLAVDVRGSSEPVTVAELPFYRRPS
jgi:aminomethyltransferase